jgi:hypothetical protein
MTLGATSEAVLIGVQAVAEWCCALVEGNVVGLLIVGAPQASTCRPAAVGQYSVESTRLPLL